MKPIDKFAILQAFLCALGFFAVVAFLLYQYKLCTLALLVLAGGLLFVVLYREFKD